MSRRKKLNKVARRQIEDIGRTSGDAFAVNRGDLLRAAKALIEELEAGDPEDLYDVLAVASFLVGDEST